MFKAFHGKAAFEGVLIARMAEPGVEVIIGMIRDEPFGPALMFGLGGIFVELYKDVSFRILPLTKVDALEMIAEVRGFLILKGARGGKPRDIEALADALLKVAAISEEHPEIDQIDLNPLIAYEQGYTVVDAKVLLRHPCERTA